MSFRLSTPHLLLAVLLAAAQDANSQSPVSITLAPSTSPSVGEPGVTNMSVTGSNFPSGTIEASSVTVSLKPAAGGSTVTTAATAVTTVAGTTRRVSFTIPASIKVPTPTAYSVSVSGTNSTSVAFSSSNTASLTVNPAATLISVTPNTGQAGQNLTVAIVGSFSNFLQSVTVANFGAGITINSTAITNATQASVSITIAANASLGLRAVTMTTGAEVASLPSGFTVQPTGNQPPVVTVSPTLTTHVPRAATLNGSVSDDGLPNGQLTSMWSVVSGPGPVVFAGPTLPTTTATFTAAGTYVLRLTASDSALTASADVTVTYTCGVMTPPPVWQPIFGDTFDRPDGDPGNGWTPWSGPSHATQIQGGELYTYGYPFVAGGVNRTLPVTFPVLFAFDFRTLNVVDDFDPTAGQNGGWDIDFNGLAKPNSSPAEVSIFQYGGSNFITREFPDGIFDGPGLLLGQRDYSVNATAHIEVRLNADLSGTIRLQYNDGRSPDPLVGFFPAHALEPRGQILAFGNSSRSFGPHIFDNLAICAPIGTNPIILSAAPNSASLNQSVTVTITAQNTHFAQGQTTVGQTGPIGKNTTLSAGRP